MIDRLDSFQRRHRLVGFPLAVVYKFFEDAGMHLVATMAYYALVATLPMALLFAALLSLLISLWPGAQEPLANSLLGTMPVIGSRLKAGATLPLGDWGLVIGLLGSLYGGLGVANAFQHAMNQVWAVPRNARPNPFRARMRSLVIVGLLLFSVIGSSLIAGSGPDPGASAASGTTSSPIWPITIFALNIAIFVVAMRYATAAPVPLRAVVPGAVVAGLLWPMFQATAMTQVRQADTTTAKGVATLILTLVALLHLGALVVVLCAELNVVLARHLHPRALLTPFTDHVDLTEADRSSYAAQAASQRFKAYQNIAVEFGPRPPPRSGKRTP